MSNLEDMKKKAFTEFDFLVNDEQGKKTITLDYGEGHKYAVFSDLHMGDGTGADNFKQNEKTFLKALEYYQNLPCNYSIILLGDIEEFHQATLSKILTRYRKSVYDALLSNRNGNRIYRVLGNHDIDFSWIDPLSSEPKRMSVEGIRLKKGNDVDILLTHGHQAEEKYEKDLHIVRFGTTAVRYLERIFKIESKSIFVEAPSDKDYIYNQWAVKEAQNGKNKIIICGHTHCPIFAKYFIDYDWTVKKYQEAKDKYREAKRTGTDEEIEKLKKRKEWLYYRINRMNRKKEVGIKLPNSPAQSLSTHYFNTGSCIFRDAITNIEIDEDTIRLVYWFNKDHQRDVFMEAEIPSILAQGI